MDTNDLLRNPAPTAGSKRPSLTQFPEAREEKKFRAEPCDDDAGCSILNNNDVYYSYGHQSDNGSASQFDYFSSGGTADAFSGSVGTRRQMLVDAYGSASYTNGDQATFHSEMAKMSDSLQPESVFATETWPGNSQGQITLDIRSRTDIPKSEQLVLSGSQANELLSQSSATSPLVESMEVDSDYDTCFGVVSYFCPNISSIF